MKVDRQGTIELNLKEEVVSMKIKQPHKNFLQALIIIGGGFVLFNLTFLLAALVIKGTAAHGSPQLGRQLFLVLIVAIFLIIALTKMPVTLKAMFLSAPLMTFVVMIGINYYNQLQWLAIGIGALFLALVAGFVYIRKLPWQYYLAILYVAVLGLIIILGGIDI